MFLYNRWEMFITFEEKKNSGARALITRDIISAGDYGLSERIERVKVDERSPRRRFIHAG